jgi:anti-sigma regulatory factor (Ser/Thr protein kinase)
MRVCLACSLAEVQTTARAVRGFLAEQGCDDHELMDYELALVEACNNAIKHVGTDGRKQPVAVEVLCDHAQVELRITDHTAGFDWPERATLPDSQRKSGRGLYLIKSLMDYANYFRGPGENVLVIRKRRTSPG